VQRLGMVIGIRPEKIDEYKRLHAEVWPEVLERLKQTHIKNYSIFLREPENLLFGYMEYHGNDFNADISELSDDPKTQEWWRLTDPCQEPHTSRNEGEQWSTMQQVFFME